MEVGGLTVKGHPKRYFMFSLVDPLDQPFTTFRFYYRNWGKKDLSFVTIMLMLLQKKLML